MCGEEARASIMAQYGLDSLEDDGELQQIVGFAARLCDAPIALVSLVEKERQRFLAREGLSEKETPRPTSFCAHAMLQAEPLVVPDAREDTRFDDNPLVTGHPHIRFYAGAPLISGEGAPLGSLCVIDTKPRTGGLSQIQTEGLRVMAAAVMRRLRHRRETLVSAQNIAQREEQLRTLIDSLPHIAFSIDEDGKFNYLNARFTELTGAAHPRKRDEWLDLVHEEDREELAREWAEAMKKGAGLTYEFRLRMADESWRWVEVNTLSTAHGEEESRRWFGTITDRDDHHRHMQSREMLASELSHRIKNIFAVVSGLIAMRSRRYPDMKEFADDLNGTIRALGRAHDFVRPVEGAKGDSLNGLLKELMAPYLRNGDDRVILSEGDCAIGPRSATPLALIFHELATNSAKYGAMSVDEGQVRIHFDCDGEDAEIVWREQNGPRPQPPADDGSNAGFGSRLVKMAVEGQLNGRMEHIWHDDGLEVRLNLPLTTIAN